MSEKRFLNLWLAHTKARLLITAFPTARTSQTRGKSYRHNGFFGASFIADKKPAIGLVVHKRIISYCVKDSGGIHAEGTIPALPIWTAVAP